MPELSEAKKKRINSLSTDEMVYEIELGRLSRFQRESFAYLKKCHKVRTAEKQLSAQNKTTPKSSNKPDNLHDWHDMPLGKIFIIVVGGLLLLCTVWAINHYFGLGL